MPETERDKHLERGGRREGAGRKPVPENERKTGITICVKRKDKCLYDRLRAETTHSPQIDGMSFVDWLLVDYMRTLARDEFGIE